MYISHPQDLSFQKTRLEQKRIFAETLLPFSGEEKRARLRCPIEDLLHLGGQSSGPQLISFDRFIDGAENVIIVRRKPSTE